jgi:hypothetical protein
VPLDLEDEVVKLHKKSFPRENSVFIMRDPVEQEEKYFVHQMNDLLEISGHYTYYEKNPCMQNYMISCRKKNGVCPTETVEDRAAKDFRSIVRSRRAEASEEDKPSDVCDEYLPCVDRACYGRCYDEQYGQDESGTVGAP